MNATHTPGSWSAENSGMVDCVFATGPYGDALRIAEMLGPNGHNNARLMAAAPDLLAALERYVKQERMAAPYSPSPLYEAACAVIARAKGGE